jgi:hypothetical protein
MFGPPGERRVPPTLVFSSALVRLRRYTPVLHKS